MTNRRRWSGTRSPPLSNLEWVYVGLRQEVAARAIGDLARVDPIIFIFRCRDSPQQGMRYFHCCSVRHTSSGLLIYIPPEFSASSPRNSGAQGGGVCEEAYAGKIIRLLSSPKGDWRTTPVICRIRVFVDKLFGEITTPSISNHAVFQKRYCICLAALGTHCCGFGYRNRSRERQGIRIRRVSGKTCWVEEEKGAPVTRPANFDLRANCSPTIPNWWCGCQRAGPCRAITQATGKGGHRAEYSAESAESPAGFPKGVLEIKRMTSFDSYRLGLPYSE